MIKIGVNSEWELLNIGISYFIVILYLCLLAALILMSIAHIPKKILDDEKKVENLTFINHKVF